MIKKTMITVLTLFGLLLFIIIANITFVSMYNSLGFEITSQIRMFCFVFLKIPVLSFLLAAFLIWIERGFKLGRFSIQIPYLIISLICFSFYSIIFIPAFFPFIQWPDFFYLVSGYFYHTLTAPLLFIIISFLWSFFLIEGLSSADGNLKSR